MSQKIITIGDWNDTIPAPPESPPESDNVRFQVDRSYDIPKISGNVRRADVSGEHYGTIIYDGSGNPLRYLGADGQFHDIPSSLPEGGTENQILAKASNDDFDVAWVNPTAAGTPTRPSYAACSIFWDIPSGLDFANLGTAGALPLALYSNAVVTLKEGIYGKCASLDLAATDAKGFLRTGNTSVGESNSISVALWIKLCYAWQYATFVGKNYYLNDPGTSPYYSWNIRTNNQSVNSTAWDWFAEVYTNGTTRNVTAPYVTDYIPLYLWTHIGFTYNAATGDLRIYKNGERRSQSNFGVYNIQYGTHGGYAVGACPQFTTRQAPGRYEDIRIYDTALSDADFWNLYIAGATRYAAP
jgi:hypothetical protein